MCKTIYLSVLCCGVFLNAFAQSSPKELNELSTKLVLLLNQQDIHEQSIYYHRIKATLNDDNFLKISEIWQDSSQTYSFRLPDLQSFEKVADSSGFYKDAFHFILKLKDSASAIILNKSNPSKNRKSGMVYFNIDDTYLSYRIESVLYNICRYNATQEVRDRHILMENTYDSH